jgi:hypothetical protein
MNILKHYFGCDEVKMTIAKTPKSRELRCVRCNVATPTASAASGGALGGNKSHDALICISPCL